MADLIVVAGLVGIEHCGQAAGETIESVHAGPRGLPS